MEAAKKDSGSNREILTTWYMRSDIHKSTFAIAYHNKYYKMIA